MLSIKYATNLFNKAIRIKWFISSFGLCSWEFSLTRSQGSIYEIISNNNLAYPIRMQDCLIVSHWVILNVISMEILCLLVRHLSNSAHTLQGNKIAFCRVLKQRNKYLLWECSDDFSFTVTYS